VKKIVARVTPNTEWISVRDMQQMLSLGRSKAYEILAQEEEIEAVTIGTTIRVNKASLHRWLRKQRYPKWRDAIVALRDG
jgi:excisionase family DNA binding protein